MKIFLSWSTEPSKFIAEALKEWIPNVIQAARPWFSDSDIDRGTRWSAEIATELENSSFGIICLTPENLSAPWINFEAGALAKTLTKTYVVPLLFELEPADLVGPLSQFNAARLNHDDMQKLVLTINKALETPLDVSVVEKSFEMWWPELEKRVLKIPKVKLAKKDKRSDRDILEEILTLVRSEKEREIPEMDQEYSRQIMIESITKAIKLQKNIEGFKVGDTVIHPKFGTGKILAFSQIGRQESVMIQFANEEMANNLILALANLKLVKPILDMDISKEYPPEEDLPF